MLKIARKIKARALDSERKTAAAAAEVAAEAAAVAAALAEPREPPVSWKSGDPKKSWKKPKILPCEEPPEKFLTEKEQRKLEKEQRKLEKKLLEQRRKAEKKKEKERKKLEKTQKKKGSAAQEPAAGAAAAGTAEGARGAGAGAATAGTSRCWAQWYWDEDDAYYREPRVGGFAWNPRSPKTSELSTHMPLMVFLLFSVRSPSWVLDFLLHKRTEHGRGCGFMFGVTCVFQMFVGCAFFSYWGRGRRRGRRRYGATASSGSGRGARRGGRGERLI